MTVTSFYEWDDSFALNIDVNGCQEGSQLVRLLAQGKLDGALVRGFFNKEKNPELQILIPKAKNRKYANCISLGSKGIR